jgi:ligand-binding sensor domain-containing protein/signal transduction histidine kinase
VLAFRLHLKRLLSAVLSTFLNGLKRVTPPVALLIGLVAPLFALDPGITLTQYAHRIWGQEEGLFQPTIYSILQTRDGFLWLGTQDSLIRFDGVHFREFESAGKTVLHGSLIWALAEDRAGNLWAGSVGNGLTRISPDGSFVPFGTKQGFSARNVFCVSSDARDRMWACTEQGLARVDVTGVRVFTTADGLPTNEIRATCEDKDGTRWVAGQGFQLARWNGGRFEQYKLPSAFANETVSSLACGKDGGVWAGTNSGLLRIDGAKSRMFTDRDGLPDNSVMSLQEDADGSLWVGTEDGISRYRNGEFSVYRIRDGLSHSLVLSLYVDQEGSLWAGTKDGLDQFTNPKVTPYTTNQGLSSNEAAAVAEDQAGRLWIGTLDRGLNVYDGHRFRNVTRNEGLSSDHILSLAVGPDGDLWAGTSNGLNRLRSGKVVAKYSTKDGLSGSEIRALVVDGQGVLWVGTEGGLNQFRAGVFVKSQLPLPAGENGVLALSGGTSVRLFVSTETNRFAFLRDDKFDSFPLTGVNRPVDCYFVNHAQRSVWMGTLGSGLLRWHDGKLAHVHVRDGLYDNRIFSILEDDHANLWMASSKGIFRVSAKELDDFADGKVQSVTSIPFSTGQLRFECRSGVQPAACRTRDGRLWFSTTTGVVVVDPNHLARNKIATPVQITTLLLNGKRVNTGQNLHLKPSERNLEVRYAGLSFVAPEKVTFRYMLEGYDKTWTDAGTRREAYFTNLPPGDFQFKVLASNQDGVWSAQPAAISFTVEPLLYQRRGFFPALALLLGLAVAAGYHQRVRRMQRQFNMVLAERSRIARELHDTLLQGLSGVTMQLHALWMRLPASKEKQTLGEIISDAGQCSVEARQSLWGLRTGEEQSALFSNKLSQLARQTTLDLVSLSLDVDTVSLDNFPEVEFQLLRITKEAISNCLKHAEATVLEIVLRQTNNELQLTLRDNGRGFSTDGEYQFLGHFGLVGMRERANEIGAVLDIFSSPRQGTEVSVRLALRTMAERESNSAAVAKHQIS